MARVTVEDCIEKIPNRFDLVMVAARRSRDVSSGAEINVERDNDKNPVVALREIADEMIKIKAAIQITSNESLPHMLEELLNNDTLSKELSCNARKYAEDGGTILESISLKISPYIVGIK